MLIIVIHSYTHGFLLAGHLSAIMVPSTRFISRLCSRKTGAQGLLSSLPQWLNHAELLQHAQVVSVVPTLHHLAAGETKDADRRKLHRLAGRGNPYELSFMCATTYDSHCDPISLGNQIPNNIMVIGEGAAKHGDQLLDALTIGHCSGGGTMVDEIGGEHLVDYSQIPLVDQLLDEAAHLGLVFFY